jgi:hypothetical protein
MKYKIGSMVLKFCLAQCISPSALCLLFGFQKAIQDALFAQYNNTTDRIIWDYSDVDFSSSWGLPAAQTLFLP